MSLSVVIFSGCFNITERYKNRKSFSLARSSSDLCSIFVLALVIVAGRHPKNNSWNGGAHLRNRPILEKLWRFQRYERAATACERLTLLRLISKGHGKRNRVIINWT